MATNGFEVGYQGSKPLASPSLRQTYFYREETAHPRTAPVSSGMPRRENYRGTQSRLGVRRARTDQEFSSLPEPILQLSRDPNSSEHLKNHPSPLSGGGEGRVSNVRRTRTDQDFCSLPEPLYQYSQDQDVSERVKSFPLSEREEKYHSLSSGPSPHLSGNRDQHRALYQRSTQGQFNQEESRTIGSSSLERRSQAGQREQSTEGSKLKASDYTDDIEDSIPRCPSGKVCSQATVENARYLLDSQPSSDHPNEDRHFAVEGENFSVWCVFDGHNGSRAAGFASNYLLKLLHQQFWKHIVKRADSAVICEALSGLFLDTEKQFFDNMEKYIERKKQLQERIPTNLTSYDAYMQFPFEVQQLQEIEPKLAGGCTAVMAVVINRVLYVANVGDSRALLVRENSPGELVAEQLSVDHTVENEDELKRLEAIGLSPKNLIKAGRLGTQENTRSIGDYSIKEGYKDVDSLRSARSPPGTAEPHIMVPRMLDSSCKYLILMTDGVYKTIESTVGSQDSPNNVILTMMQRELKNVHSFELLSGSVLERIRTVNENIYMQNAREDIRSPLAVACRKRDDMTLIVHKLTNNR